jgi:uncharacterized protein
MMDTHTVHLKKEKLMLHIEKLESLVVAFSGGVDSTFLLAVAHEVLKDRVLAVTASSPAHPREETAEAVEFAKGKGIDHVVIYPKKFQLPAFRANRPDRCYHCKRNISLELLEIARNRGFRHVAHGANADDLGDYRPGLKAAEELNIEAPLLVAQLGKEEIRFLSKEMGLPTWDLPSRACLASRIPYGESITEAKLEMIAKAERFLAANGFRQYRVRHHGTVARIELEEAELDRAADSAMRKNITQALKEIGFAHVCLDLEGYRMGSLNRVLSDPGVMKNESSL